MDYAQLKKDLEGLYITIPTLFHDEDLSINEEGIRTHIRFLKENGINKENAVLLAGGAAGDFSTMSFEERIRVASIVIDEAGNIPVAMGAQTTSTQELIRLSNKPIDLELPLYKSLALFTSTIQKMIFMIIFRRQARLPM